MAIMMGAGSSTSLKELVEQLKKDIRDLIGSNITTTDAEEVPGVEKMARAKGKHQKSDGGGGGADPDRDYYYSYQKYGYGKLASVIDGRNMKMRLQRAVVMMAVTVYAWALSANEAAFLGFGVALFDLFIGLGTMLAFGKLVRSRKKSNGAAVNVHSVQSWVERTKAYRWARKEFQERLRLAAYGVALAGSSTTRARRYLNILFALAPAMVLGAGLASVILHPYFIFIAVVPGLIIAVPFLSLKLKRAERSEIDDELPFFLIVAEMFALVEKPLIHAFETLAGKDLLPKMRREAEIVRRDVNVFGYTPEQAIDNLATSHPNAEFRALLRGYLGSVSLGQNVAQYFQNKAETYLARLEAKYERFRENAGTAGEVMLIVLMIVPVTGLMYGASGGVASDLALVMAIPIMAMGVFFMLDRAQVKGPQQQQPHQSQNKKEEARMPVLPVIAGAVAATVTIPILQVEPVTGLLASVAVFAILNGITVRRMVKYQDALLLELAEFVRAVAEGMKTGLDVVSAMRHAGTDRFRVLRPQVRRIKHAIAAGETMDGAYDYAAIIIPASGFFYIRYTLFLISVLAASGATSYGMLDRLAEYLGRVREQSARVRKSVTVYGFLVVASPLFMMFTVHAMESISSFTQSSPDIGYAGSGMNIPPPTMQFSSNPATIQLTLLLTTLCSGALGGKIMSQTARDTMPLGIACIIAIVSPIPISVIWPAT